MASLAAAQASRTTLSVDPRSVSLPKLPRLGGMRAEPGSSSRGAGGRSSHGPDPSSLRFGGGSRTKAGVEQARRKAREMAHFSSKNSVLARPTHRLNERPVTQVRVAPKGLVEDHRRGPGLALEEKRRAPVVVGAPRVAVAKADGGGGPMSREERERRLKNIAAQGARRRAESGEGVADGGGGSGSGSGSEGYENDSPRLPQAASYKIPRPVAAAPENRPRIIVKSKAPVDIFMPAKKRRVN